MLHADFCAAEGNSVHLVQYKYVNDSVVVRAGASYYRGIPSSTPGGSKSVVGSNPVGSIS